MTDNKNDEPKMIFEFVVPATALVSGSKFAYDVKKDISVAQKPEKPLFISVLGTRTIDDKHEIVIEIQNLGVHGVYLETVESKEPDNLNPLAFFHEKNTDKKEVFEQKPIGLSYNSKFGEPILPVLLPSQNSICLKFVFEKLASERLKSKPFGKFKLNYTVSGVAKTDLSIEIPFSVRL
ncbi:TPA: hypothetical protein ACPVW4_004477 [Vibrio parahaemolyticus]